MTTYYLRIEAVNLVNFVYDTQDLSTIRGGSMLIREAVARRIGQRFPDLEAVSVGASAGLFRFEVSEVHTGKSKEQALAVRNSVAEWLSRDDELSHATFVVDVTKAATRFVLARERLLAKNRFRQMQQPSLIMPGLAPLARTECQIDGLRPGVRVERIADQDVWYSESTYVRRGFGRNMKRHFYEEESGVSWGVSESERPVVWDFEELTGDPSQGSLHHKMALIYLDGNRFGKIQSRVCTTEEIQKDFDKTVREYRKMLLSELIRWIKDKPDWTTQDGRHRIETLLWGGDEIIWVVPAWQGWATLSFFFEHTKDWTFRQNPLTHAAGLVFASKNSPIQRVRSLAERLAGLAKEQSREENYFAYQVLESFDYVDDDISCHLKKRFPAMQSAQTWAIAAEKMQMIAKDVAALCADEQFSKSKLHQLAAGSQHEVALIENGFDPKGQASSTIASLKSQVGALRWHHVAELWDYLPSSVGRGP